MQKVTRRRTDRRLRVPGLWRLFILLMVLAFAASGLLHGTSGHATGAELHAHDLALVIDDSSDGAACCHETDGQAHEPVCSTAAGCSLCVPIVSAVLLVRADADRAEMEPNGSHSGLIQPPQIRPPKLMATD